MELLPVPYVRHSACPRCVELGRDTSKDNLGTWPDGHQFCFSCGWRNNPTNSNIDQLSARLRSKTNIKNNNKNNDATVDLPSDFTVNLPEIALNWLRRYEITDAEIDMNWMGWSQQYERLIFPVFDRDGHLLMYQGRRFREFLSDKPKYHTEGFPEKIFHILGDSGGKSLCIVEDLVSAIKVARVMPCMPLWGSMISTPRLTRLSDLFTNLVVWLDNDKQEYAIKRGVAAQPFFFGRVSTIITDEDPKVYSTQQIQEILTYEQSDTRPR